MVFHNEGMYPEVVAAVDYKTVQSLGLAVYRACINHIKFFRFIKLLSKLGGFSWRLLAGFTTCTPSACHPHHVQWISTLTLTLSMVSNRYTGSSMPICMCVVQQVRLQYWKCSSLYTNTCRNYLGCWINSNKILEDPLNMGMPYRTQLFPCKENKS